MKLNNLLNIFKNDKVESNVNSTLLNDLNKAIELNPNSFEAYIERSKVKRTLNDEKGANQDVKIARLLVDKLDGGLKAYDIAVLNYESDDYEKAIEYFTKAISGGVETSSVYYYRGLSKKYIKDIQGAFEDLNRAIEKDKNYVDAYYDRGKINYYEFKNYNAALSDYNKVIEIEPNNAKAYSSRASVKSAVDEIGAAIQDYNKSIELDPTIALSYFSRGTEKFRMEDYKGAINDLDRVIEIGLTDDDYISVSDVYSLRGGFKNLVKDYEGAILDFTNLIKLDPENGEAYYKRAEARIELGQSEDAFNDKIMAVKLGYDEDAD